MLLINQSRIQRCYGSAPGDPSFYTLRSFFLSLRYEGAPSTIFHSRGDLIALMTHSSLLEHSYCLMLPVACSSLFHSDHSSYSRFDFLFFAINSWDRPFNLSCYYSFYRAKSDPLFLPNISASHSGLDPTQLFISTDIHSLPRDRLQSLQPRGKYRPKPARTGCTPPTNPLQYSCTLLTCLLRTPRPLPSAYDPMEAFAGRIFQCSFQVLNLKEESHNGMYCDRVSTHDTP